MQRKSKYLFVFLLSAVVTITTGCTEFSRSIGRMADNKYADPRGGTVWIVPPPQLEPPSQENKTVYISFRNISDAQDVDLLAQLRESATKQGWTLVNDPNRAKYRLRASLRFFGEVEPESRGASVGNGMGAITGAAVAIGTYSLARNVTSSRGRRTAGAAVVGGMVAAGIASTSKPREWAMIIDIVLEEYSNKTIEYEMVANSGSGTGDVAGTSNSRVASVGATKTGNTSAGTMTKKSNYFPHGIRLSVWANQMNMKQDEALPVIHDKLVRVANQMLPL